MGQRHVALYSMKAVLLNTDQGFQFQYSIFLAMPEIISSEILLKFFRDFNIKFDFLKLLDLD